MTKIPLFIDNATQGSGYTPIITTVLGRYSSHKNLLKIYIDKKTIGVYVNVVTGRCEEEMLFLPGMALGLIKQPYKDKNID